MNQPFWAIPYSYLNYNIKELHADKSKGGRRVPGKKMWKATISYKTTDLVCNATHIACHVYTFGPGNYHVRDVDVPRQSQIWCAKPLAWLARRTSPRIPSHWRAIQNQASRNLSGMWWLFHIARSYIQNSRADTVIICHLQRPWGMSDCVITKLTRDQLVEAEISCHNVHSIKTIRMLSTSLFFWSKERIRYTSP